MCHWKQWSQRYALRSTRLRVHASCAASFASLSVRYEFFGRPSRLKCEATRPSGFVNGFAARRRLMEPDTNDLTKVCCVTSHIETEQIVTSSTQVDDEDHERFTHIVLEGYTPTDGEFVALNNSVVGGMINATPVIALCGKVWVPGRDPQKYPICPTCKEIAESMGWSLPAN